MTHTLLKDTFYEIYSFYFISFLFRSFDNRFAVFANNDNSSWYYDYVCYLHSNLFTDKAYILKPLPSSANWLTVQIKNGLNYIGVPVVITYDNGRFEVAIQGVQESTRTYDVTSLPQPTSWYVSFFAATGVELGFTEPCINDFNPQFNPYYR